MKEKDGDWRANVLGEWIGDDLEGEWAELLV